MNKKQNEWKGECGEEKGLTITYITAQIYKDGCCGKRIFKQDAEIVRSCSALFISSFDQYCPISVLDPVSLTFINKLDDNMGLCNCFPAPNFSSPRRQPI